MNEPSAEPGLSRRMVEVVVAGVLLALAALAMYDNAMRGAGWASDGPQSGYFPARLALILFLAAGFALWSALRAPDEIVVTYAQLIKIAKLFVPLSLYVLGIDLIGLYLPSALFLAIFMIWLGEFRWATSIASAIALTIVIFLIFEIWFQVPLPKGPVEAFFGF